MTNCGLEKLYLNPKLQLKRTHLKTLHLLGIFLKRNMQCESIVHRTFERPEQGFYGHSKNYSQLSGMNIKVIGK